MAITLNDIADLAGVSVSTVSRVLNKKSDEYRIGAETESRVLGAAEELNYRPNQVARGLRLNKTHTIGIIVPDISNPFFAYLIKRVQNIAHSLGYTVVVCDTDEHLEQEVEHVNVMYRNRVDGLIAMPVGKDYGHYAEWNQRGRPLVLLDRCFDEMDVSSVIVDNFAGSKEAVEHLIAHGHRRIGIIRGHPGTYAETERLRGYVAALEEQGLPTDDALVVGGDVCEQAGYMETKLLLTAEVRPTALFATSERITLGALKALAEEGVRVPSDVSLIMFDDVDFAPYLTCPITAIRPPKELMGEMAVKLLAEELKGERKSARRIVLTTQLIVRDSVASSPTLQRE